MGLILKNPLAGETGVRGFSKLGEDFFFFLNDVIVRKIPSKIYI
jgi:hypothetical protein